MLRRDRSSPLAPDHRDRGTILAVFFPGYGNDLAIHRIENVPRVNAERRNEERRIREHYAVLHPRKQRDLSDDF